MNNNNIVLLGIIILVIIAFLFLVYPGKCTRENYRDPIYLNRAKMIYDWYPRTNGSIYGWSNSYGGSWNIFSGYPYYTSAY